jgi:hypothetical protein
VQVPSSRAILMNDRAGLFRAVARDIGLRARHFRTADQGSDENSGFEARDHAAPLSACAGFLQVLRCDARPFSLTAA